MVRLPQVLWAQQSDRLFLTIDLQDSKDPQIKLNNDSEKKCGTVFFDGAAKSTATGPELHEYKLDLELFGEVDPDESKISRKDRSVVLVIAKKEQGHWDRLLKTSARMPNIKVHKLECCGSRGYLFKKYARAACLCVSNCAHNAFWWHTGGLGQMGG